MRDALAADAAHALSVRTRTDGADANEIGVVPFASTNLPTQSGPAGESIPSRLGYTEHDIRAMTPSDAWQLLRKSDAAEGIRDPLEQLVERAEIDLDINGHREETRRHSRRLR